MRFLIIGAGAIGGYVGGSLAAAGHPVTFLVRPAAAAALTADGLRLTVAQTGASQTIRSFAVAATPAAVQAGGPYDCAILATKAYDTASAAESLQAALAEPPPILCLQNGVDGEAELASIFGAARVLSGTVTTSVSKPAPGQLVVEKSRGLGIALGHPLSLPLVDALNGAGILTRGYPAAGPMKWSKLFTNLAGNATAAILDLPVSEVFADPRLFAVEMGSLRECLAVMAALHYEVVDLPRLPVRALAWAVRYLPRWAARPVLRRGIAGGRGAKMPSLYLDLHAGRPQTEVRWLHGAVARYGISAGVPAPISRELSSILEALTAGQFDLADFRRRPEALLSRLSSWPDG